MANWLSAQLEAMPNHSILLALATDERMSAVYADLRKWSPGALSLIALVVHFSTPTILSNLQKPSEERWSLSWPEYRLGAVAGEFATMLEWWPNAARELWGEPVDALVECLRAFAPSLLRRSSERRLSRAFTTTSPSRIGADGAVQNNLPFARHFLACCTHCPSPTRFRRNGKTASSRLLPASYFPDRQLIPRRSDAIDNGAVK